jgi:hypothetical protein
MYVSIHCLSPRNEHTFAITHSSLIHSLMIAWLIVCEMTSAEYPAATIRK